MPLRRLSVLAVRILLFLSFVKNSEAEVGVVSPDGFYLRTHSTFGPQSWTLTGEGCRVGKAANLVVTPLGGSTADGGEALDTQRVGPLLCSWLSMMEKAHNEMRAAWQNEHKRRKAKVPFWNIYRRFVMWYRSFPALEFHVEVRYLALWNKDRFGHPMPWATAVFGYKCPKGDVGYGLFDHLCGSVFSHGRDPRVGSEVHLLLQPRLGFNRPLEVQASNWQYISGALAGLRGGRTKDQQDRDERFIWPVSVYTRTKSIMTISGKIDDCWMNDGYCYFKW